MGCVICSPLPAIQRIQHKFSQVVSVSSFFRFLTASNPHRLTIEGRASGKVSNAPSKPFGENWKISRGGEPTELSVGLYPFNSLLSRTRYRVYKLPGGLFLLVRSSFVGRASLFLVLKSSHFFAFSGFTRSSLCGWGAS